MSEFNDLEGEFDSIKEYSYNDLKNDKFLSHFKPRSSSANHLNYSFNIRMKARANGPHQNVDSNINSNINSNTNSDTNTNTNTNSSPHQNANSNFNTRTHKVHNNANASSANTSNANTGASGNIADASDLSGAFDSTDASTVSMDTTLSHKKKRNVVLVGQEDLNKYLREKKKRRLLKKQARIQLKLEKLAMESQTSSANAVSEPYSTSDVTMDQAQDQAQTNGSNRSSKKKKRVYLVPMDEEYRQKMLAWIERRKNQTTAGNSGNSRNTSQNSTKSGKSANSGGSINGSQQSRGSNGPVNEIAGSLEQDRVDLSVGESVDGSMGILLNSEAGEISLDQDLNDEFSQPAKFREVVSSESEVEEPIQPSGPLLASPNDVSLLKKTILSQIHGGHMPRLYPLWETPYKEVYSLFEQTVQDSENQTAFLMGPSGSGKSRVVEKALESIRDKYPKTFIVIRLTGDLHTTDKAAIREMARQLDSQVKELTTTVAESAFEQRSISDTFDNILTALNKLDTNLHRTEEDNDNSDGKETVRVLVIIDKIEKYTQTPRQTLLYNLLDLCQSSKIPICLLGITSNISIRENLEKRVRSRFSQRIIETKKAPDLQTFWENARIPLSIDTSEFASYVDPTYPESWNQHLRDQFNSTSRPLSSLQRLVVQIFTSTRNYSHLFNCCCLAVKSITEYQPFPQPHKFDAAFHNMISNSFDGQMYSLSEAEQLLLIAAARWAEKSESSQVNFKLAYKEYKGMVKSSNLEATTLTSKTSSIDNLSLAGIKVTRTLLSAKALKDSWATLYRYGLLFDVIQTNNEVNAQNNHNRNKEVNLADDKLLKVDVSLDELGIIALESLKRYTKL